MQFIYFSIFPLYWAACQTAQPSRLLKIKQILEAKMFAIFLSQFFLIFSQEILLVQHMQWAVQLRLQFDMILPHQSILHCKIKIDYLLSTHRRQFLPLLATVVPLKITEHLGGRAECNPPGTELSHTAIHAWHCCTRRYYWHKWPNCSLVTAVRLT